MEKKESQAKPARKPARSQTKPARKPARRSQTSQKASQKASQKPSQASQKPSQASHQKSQPGCPLRALALQKQRQLWAFCQTAYLGVIILQPHACTQRFRLRILCRTRSNAGRTSARSLSGRIESIWEPSKERGAMFCVRAFARRSLQLSLQSLRSSRSSRLNSTRAHESYMSPT